VSLTDTQIASLREIFPGATAKADAGKEYVYLPQLKVTVGSSVKMLDGLLCPSDLDGYQTRLLLAEPIAERQTINGQSANWRTYTILGRTWHTWSWRNIPSNLPLVQMLLEHLRALR
jgi:hypothetical protein